MRPVLRSLIRSLGAIVPRPLEPPSRRREIVLIRPDHLGDGILTLPALRYLRRQASWLSITLLHGPWTVPLFAAAGLADTTWIVPFPAFSRAPRRSPWAPYTLLWREAARLRRRCPLAAVVLRDDDWWSAWLCALAGIPLRIGSAHPHLRQFLTHPVPLHARHVAARNLELVLAALRILGVDREGADLTPQRFPLLWPIDRAAAGNVRALLGRAGIASDFAVIHPGAGAPAKCWPNERWAQVADALAQRGLAVVLTGSAHERPDIEAIARLSRAPTTVLPGLLSIPMLAELLRSARVVVGPDTGPLHLAVAVGTPTVHLFGPTDPERFGPWGPPDRHRVLRSDRHCARCGDIDPRRALGVGCMIAITPERVVAEIADLLAMSSAG